MLGDVTILRRPARRRRDRRAPDPRPLGRGRLRDPGRASRIGGGLDVLKLDTGTGALQAIPQIRIEALIGADSAVGAPRLLDTGPAQFGSVHVGLRLDDHFRPQFALTLHDVDVSTGGTPRHHDLIDLSTPGRRARRRRRPHRRCHRRRARRARRGRRPPAHAARRRPARGHRRHLARRSDHRPARRDPGLLRGPARHTRGHERGAGDAAFADHR